MAQAQGWTPVPEAPPPAVVASAPGWTPVPETPAAPALPLFSRTGPSRVGTVATDLAVGAAKGLGQTATNLGRLAHMVPLVSAATDALYGLPKGASDEAFRVADQVLTPANTTQRVGKIGEQIAEVIVPSKAITTAGTAAVTRLAPKLAPVVGETAAKILPRVAVEAAGNAGMSAAQGGDPLVGGAVGAVAGVLPAIGGSRAVSVLREQAEKKVVQALGPTKERFKAMAERLAPKILERGLGGSRKALQERAAGMVEEVGAQVDEALQQFGSRAIGIQPISDALEQAKGAFQTVQRMTPQEALRRGLARASGTGGALTFQAGATLAADGMVDVAVQFEPRAIKQIEGLQGILGGLGDTATVDQLVAVRRAWDKVVDQAGGFAHRAGGAIGVPLKDQSEAWAKREATGAIRKVLEAEVPELAAVNKEFSFWKSLDQVLTQTLQRTEAQGPGLGRQVAEAAGAAAASSHGLGPAVLAGKVGKMANAVFTSPRWRFVDAHLRNRLADAITSGSAGQTTSVLTRIAAVEGSKLDLTPIP